MRRRQPNTFQIVKLAAKAVVDTIGYGHREAVYQRALTVELMNHGVSSMTEVPVPFFTRGVCVGIGRIDVLTDHHIIEIKTHTMSKILLARSKQQTRKYLSAMRKVNGGNRHRKGMLILFDNSAEKLFIRCLPA